MILEWANAHDAGECRLDCPHPDHAYDSEPCPDVDWLIEAILSGSRVASQQYPDEVASSPVML